jgi:hypothetical protein
MILAAGSWHRVAPLRTRRPDVAELLGVPELVASGFVVELPLAWFQGDELPRFFGRSGAQTAELENHGELRLE